MVKKRDLKIGSKLEFGVPLASSSSYSRPLKYNINRLKSNIEISDNK